MSSASIRLCLRSGLDTRGLCSRSGLENTCIYIIYLYCHLELRCVPNRDHSPLSAKKREAFECHISPDTVAFEIKISRIARSGARSRAGAGAGSAPASAPSFEKNLIKITQQQKYMKYFECIGPGKGKISVLLLTRSGGQQLLDTKLAEVTNAQKKQRVEDQSDPPLDPGTSIQAAPASQRSGTSQQPRTPASALARTHTSLPAQRHPFWLCASAKAAHPS